MTDDDLTAEEKDFFRKSMQNVKPIKCVSKDSYKSPAPIKSPIQKLGTTKNFANDSMHLANKRNHNVYSNASHSKPHFSYIENKYQHVGSEDIICFRRDGISTKILNDLKSSRQKHMATLDLHGLLPDAAALILSNFIEEQHLKGRKIILIIHGKSGKHSNPPIIKNLVNNLLRLIPHVLAFHSAQLKHGGAGAVYVLLKNPSNLSRV